MIGYWKIPMTVTICIRLPAGCGHADTAAVRQVIRLLLPVAEPAALVLTDAAGLGWIGRLLVFAAIRSARRATGG